MYIWLTHGQPNTSLWVPLQRNGAEDCSPRTPRVLLITLLLKFASFQLFKAIVKGHFQCLLFSVFSGSWPDFALFFVESTITASSRTKSTVMGVKKSAGNETTRARSGEWRVVRLRSSPTRHPRIASTSWRRLWLNRRRRTLWSRKSVFPGCSQPDFVNDENKSIFCKCPCVLFFLRFSIIGQKKWALLSRSKKSICNHV